MRSFSMSSPLRPITTPGRAVWIVMLALRAARSMWMRLTEASFSLARRNSRTRQSDRMYAGKLFVSAYQRDVQSRVMPRRMPIGLTF